MSVDVSQLTTLYGRAEKLFTEEERNAFTEFWTNIRYVSIPGQRGVDEHVQIMQW